MNLEVYSQCRSYTLKPSGIRIIFGARGQGIMTVPQKRAERATARPHYRNENGFPYILGDIETCQADLNVLWSPVFWDPVPHETPGPRNAPALSTPCLNAAGWSRHSLIYLLYTFQIYLSYKYDE